MAKIISKLGGEVQLSPVPSSILLFSSPSPSPSFALYFSLSLISRAFGPLKIQVPGPPGCSLNRDIGAGVERQLCTLPPLEVPWMTARVPQLH